MQRTLKRPSLNLNGRATLVRLEAAMRRWGSTTRRTTLARGVLMRNTDLAKGTSVAPAMATEAARRRRTGEPLHARGRGDVAKACIPAWPFGSKPLDYITTSSSLECKSWVSGLDAVAQSYLTGWHAAQRQGPAALAEFERVNGKKGKGKGAGK